MMKKTSFGTMQTLFEKDHKIAAEFLSFESEGRSHTHDQYETCYISSGNGEIAIGEETWWVEPHTLITIPPNTPHWMIPGDETPLDILIFYHDEPLTVVEV